MLVMFLIVFYGAMSAYWVGAFASAPTPYNAGFALFFIFIGVLFSLRAILYEHRREMQRYDELTRI